MKRTLLLAGLMVVVLAAPLSAYAAPLTVQSYSMYNGATGSYDYRDFIYTPDNGNSDVTGALLSGGTGKLTDGVLPTSSWYAYGWDTPWVGWSSQVTNGTNPTVTFNFGSTVTINSVTVWVDNSLGYGGVFLPASVSIDGTNFPIAPDWTNGAPRGYTFPGLNITGNSADVQFFQSSYPWIMVGEVSFNGTSATVPEPSTLIVWSILGSLAVGLGWWRARRA